MPLESRKVSGREREPDEKAAEAEVLRGNTVAYIRAAKSETKHALGDQHQPANRDDPMAAGFAICDPKRQQQKDGNDCQR